MAILNRLSCNPKDGIMVERRRTQATLSLPIHLMREGLLFRIFGALRYMCEWQYNFTHFKFRKSVERSFWNHTKIFREFLIQKHLTLKSQVFIFQTSYKLKSFYQLKIYISDTNPNLILVTTICIVL